HPHHLLPARRQRPADGVREQAGHQVVPRRLQAGEEVRPPTFRLAVAGVLVAAAAALSSGPEEALKAFAGKWVLSDAVLAGRAHKDDFEGMKLSVTGNAYVLDFGPNSDKGTITLDATKTPRWIDLTTQKDGPFKGRTLPGVYKIDCDTLTVCLDSQAKARP